MPTDEVLRKFYAHAFNYDWYADHLLHKRLDSAERIRDLKGYLGKSALDYGGGLGYFAAACRKAGIQSETYDPYSPGASRELSRKWDSVVSLHSLEHSNDLARTVTELKGLLKENGKLVVAVPNAQSSSYLKKGMAAVWAQPPLLHIFHFSEKNLRILFSSYGFEVEKVIYADRWDANHVADALLQPFFSHLDGKWGTLGKNWFRRAYAISTGFLRRCALMISRAFFKTTDQELNVICNLRAGNI